MTANSSAIESDFVTNRVSLGTALRRRVTPLVFVAICLIFAILSPSFASAENLINILQQSVVLALVALGMTLVVISGGIDLSVAIALDFGAMGAVAVLQAQAPWPLAIVSGLVVGTLVGLFNAVTIVKIGISPLLATLGTLFIGESIQRIFTGGGEPIYMASMPAEYRFMTRGQLFDVLPFQLVILLFVAIIFYVLVEHTIHSRIWRATGAQYEAARVAGLHVDRYGALSYILCALVCAAAGILLSSTLRSYVPLSGAGYTLDAIGAVFIGTSVDRENRPNVLGTLLGVVFLGVVTNGLRMIGLNFYWQAVARGVFILIALVLGVLNRQKRA